VEHDRREGGAPALRVIQIEWGATGLEVWFPERLAVALVIIAVILAVLGLGTAWRGGWIG